MRSKNAVSAKFMVLSIISFGVGLIGAGAVVVSSRVYWFFKSVKG